MTKSLSDITKEIKALKGEPVTTKVEKVEMLNKTKTGGKTKGHGPISDNGGARVGAGRPPGGVAAERRARKLLAEQALSGLVTMKVRDPKTGTEIVVEKAKVVGMLDKTFQTGMEGNTTAQKEWLDRALGKAPQPLVGDEDSDAIQVNVNAGEMLDKIYEDENEN